MKTFTCPLRVAALLGGASAVAWAGPDAHISPRPEMSPLNVKGQGAESCEIQLRYDDGTDDIGSGILLGYNGSVYQFLGVRFTPPAGDAYEVVSASFFTQWWRQAGHIQVQAMLFDDWTNPTVDSVFVVGPGTWSVRFTTPLCVPAGQDYAIMLCSSPGGSAFGGIGGDQSDPDFRSRFSSNWKSPDRGCVPVDPVFPHLDLMIWSCVEKCETVSATERSWGSLKSLYR